MLLTSEILFLVITWVITLWISFLIIRAAMRSALERVVTKLEQSFQLQTSQTELLSRIANQTAAQTELGVLTA